jgi:BirA family transcriptional regulator, biotin operon repressor / biotin---[acetyl-CoA-carboxylase] ligase
MLNDNLLNELQSEGALITENESNYQIDLSQAFGSQSCSLALGESVWFAETCDSTQRQASALSSQYSIFISEHQSEGRGRLARRWESEAGKNILLSMVLKPDLPITDLPRCTLLWAAAIAKSLDLFVKWPNDIVTSDGQKVGGILSRLEMDGGSLKHVVFGIGLNVSQQQFDGLPQATSLSIVRNKGLSRLTVLKTIVSAVRSVDVSSSLELWRSRTTMLGTLVTVGDITGVAEDVREDGALIIDGKAILSGDVSLVENLT